MDEDEDLRKVTIISWAAIAALAVLLAVVAWLAWPGPEAGDPPRAREYGDYDLCLLTDESGIQGEAAAKAWRGLQTVSLETKSRVSFLPVMGEQTEAVAAQLVAAQVQQSCDVIVAVGDSPAGAVAQNAARYPAVHFVVLGTRMKAAGVEIAAEEIDPSSVAALVRPLVAG